MNKFQLDKTCGACPEQYDVYLDGVEVGYMRLRHGFFTVECQGEEVYSASPNGDGEFEDDEREHYLNEGCKAIRHHLLAKGKAKPKEGELIFEFGTPSGSEPSED